MRIPEWVLYLRLIEMRTAVSGSSWRARRSLPESMPSRPVTARASSIADRLGVDGVADDQHVLVGQVVLRRPTG